MATRAGIEAGAPSWSKLRRIGIFGGSFDPVHLGHLFVASTAQAARDLERVVFVPAAQAPHKLGQAVAPGADRVAMLELALADHPDWCIDELELERSGPSFTIDTIRQVRGRWGLHPQARLFLILGSDNLRGFAQWKEIEALLELTEPVVVARERRIEPALEALRSERGPELAARLERALIPCEPYEVSSSEIREALAHARPTHAQLPAKVAEYIAAHGIYGAGSRSKRQPE